MKSILMILVAMLLATAPVHAQNRDRVDVDVERLQGELRRLDNDPVLGPLGAVERLQARQAVQAVGEARSNAREHRIYVADRRIETARAAAEAERARDQVQQLERERDRIVLDAARRDAEMSRREAERLRLQSMTRQEEALRALQEREMSLQEAEAAMAQAEQSARLAEARGREASLARQEADLASAAADSLRRQLENLDSRSDARGDVMTLSGEVFAPGQAQLRTEALANLDRVVEFVQGQPGARVLIEGHTDATGSANLNQSLSQQRAESVRRALVDLGVEGSRIEATGYGQTRPVADNATEQGRSRNRRVDIILAN